MAKAELEMSVTEVDAIWRAADPQLIDYLAQAICRGCVAYEVRLPFGCLTAIIKNILFTLERRKGDHG